jgi:hypothetical protein
MQNKSNYNPAYTKYTCTDCVNYVSQALKAGGIFTDSTWQPYTNAWINTYSLDSYLEGIWSGYRMTLMSQLSYIQPGDLAWTTSWDHVVMYSGVNPARYSGHTNDRLLWPFSSSPTLTHWGLINVLPQ